MAKAGRPASFTQSTADTICERLANGESLRTITSDETMPGQTTVYRWLSENEKFREQYSRAREDQAETLVDEIIEIADNGTNDWMLTKRGDTEAWTENGESIRRSQMRIHARQWFAGKVKPKKYGDAVKLAGSLEIPGLKEFFGALPAEYGLPDK